MEGIVFLFIMLAAGGAFVSRLTRTRRKAALQMAGDELGLSVTTKGLGGDINGYLVSVDQVSQNDQKTTRIRVAYPQWLGYNLRVATDQLGELRKIPLFGNVMPAQDIQIGHDKIDTRHLIQGDEAPVRNWFTARKIDMVSRAAKSFSKIEITDRRVETWTGKQITDPEALTRQVRAVIFMAEVASMPEAKAPAGSDPFKADYQSGTRTDEPKVVEVEFDKGFDDELYDDVEEIPALPDPVSPPEPVLEPVAVPESDTDESVFVSAYERDPAPELEMFFAEDTAPTEPALEPIAESEPVAEPIPTLEPMSEAQSDPIPTPEPEAEAESAATPVAAPIDEPVDEPSSIEELAIEDLADRLFADYSPAYQIEEDFKTSAQGAVVTWTGTLESVGEFRRDRHLGEGPGVELELKALTLDDGREILVFAALPENSEVDGIRTGGSMTVRGRLSSIDAIMRRLYLTDAELV